MFQWEDDAAEIERIRASVAEMESSKIRQRIVATLQWRAEHGELLPSVPPLGYRREGGGFAVNPEGAAVVSRIFDLYTSRTATQVQIADELNASDVLGRKWTPQYIGRILRNQAYRGYLSVQIEGTCYLRQSTLVPQIISDDTWDRAQARRGRPHPE